MSAPKRRVLIRPDDEPLLDDLMDATGLDSAQAITLLLRRHAAHLAAWIRSNPYQETTSAPIFFPPAMANPTELDEENLSAIEL